MSFAARCLAAQDAESPIVLTADKTSYLEDDLRDFSGATFAPQGEKVVMKAVTPWDLDVGGCPRLVQRMVLPDGTKKEGEVKGHCRASDDFPGQVEIKFDTGHVSTWSGLGEYRFRVALANGPESNEVVIQIEDAAKIRRKFGLAQKGVAVDLELDKESFAPGEDVALHAALENFDGDWPIYGESPIWHPFAALKIEVREANGELLKESCPRFIVDGGPMGLARYPKGMIVPLEYSLDNMGILPNHEGTFTVLATWRTYEGTDDKCHMCEVPVGYDSEKPYAVARSQVRTFKVVSGGKKFPGCW